MLKSKTFLLPFIACVLFACGSPTEPANPGAEQSNLSPTSEPTNTARPTEAATSTPIPSPETAAVSPTLVPTQAEETNASAGIEIIGSDGFVFQTELALDLLASCAPEAMQTAAEYIDVIQESERSGMLVGEGVFLASEITAFAPGYSEPAQQFWYAGAIVHDAHHREQSEQGRTVRWDVLTVEEREALEAEARQVQIDALEMCTDQLPASTQREWSFMLQYLIDMQTGATECDYCEVEWENRNW